MLTKKQDAVATQLRDAGVPGDIAVLLASRSVMDLCLNRKKSAVGHLFYWDDQPEGWHFWHSFNNAYFDECAARGIK